MTVTHRQTPLRFPGQPHLTLVEVTAEACRWLDARSEDGRLIDCVVGMGDRDLPSLAEELRYRLRIREGAA
jgi:hypothetical protein